jgi:hypothetical protein
MAEPSGTEPEPESGNPEARRLVERAFALLEEGQRLPSPATWEELLAGMAAWLVRRWSDESGVRRRCSNCGSDDWEVGPVVSLDASPRWPGPEERGHGSFPYFQIGCRACGNTIFISALTVFEPQPQTPP